MKQYIRKAAAPVALVLGVGIAATAMDAVQDPIPHLDAQAALAADDPGSLANAFRNASKAALPAVVRVEVEAAPRSVRQQLPEGLRGSPFEDFFGAPQGPPRPQMGSGSGVLISPDGHILTNNHVVQNATRVKVVLTDRREFDATVVGTDPNTDVAVLKVEGEGLPSARLGNVEALEVGDWVLALGYPMSLGETVTAGIVSAKGRSIDIMQRNDAATAPLEHFIQTDAAINPGNSGGPLVNLRGEVVGINTAIASPTGTYTGYGFSVPINLARRVADDLVRYGAVRRPKLGVRIRNTSPADVEVFGLSDARGSVVASDPEGPAAKAGLRMGDVIVAVDGAPVKDTGELMERVALRQPGERVTLEIVRYGDRKRVAVELGSFDSTPPVRAAAEVSEGDVTSRLGFAATALTPEIARQLRIEDASGGVVITRVDPMGSAPQALAGMRVERVNGKEIASTAQLREVAATLKAGSTVSVIGRLPDGSSTIVNYRLRG